MTLMEWKRLKMHTPCGMCIIVLILYGIAVAGTSMAVHERELVGNVLVLPMDRGLEGS